MKTLYAFAFFILMLPLSAIPGFAQDPGASKHELGLMLGAISAPSRTLAAPSGQLSTSTGLALEANYGYRLIGGERMALYGEVHFLANGLRDISSNLARVTHDYATLYVTPGVRLKFVPRRRLSPYVAVGGGYALYEQSLFTQNQLANPEPRFRHRGAFDAAGGADYKFWRFVSLRGEFRYFYTGNPAFNAIADSSGQHNLVGSGGLALRWGK